MYASLQRGGQAKDRGPQPYPVRRALRQRKALTRRVGDVDIEVAVGTKAGDALAIAERAAAPAGGASSHSKGARPKLERHDGKVAV